MILLLKVLTLIDFKLLTNKKLTKIRFNNNYWETHRQLNDQLCTHLVFNEFSIDL